MKITQETQIKFLEEFANKLDCKLELEGEIGFGRPCVGILNGQGLGASYLGYNLDIRKHEEWDKRLNPPGYVNSYHKGNYIAVLIEDKVDKDEAIKQLYEWVKGLDQYELGIRSYSDPEFPSIATFMGISGGEPELFIK